MKVTRILVAGLVAGAAAWAAGPALAQSKKAPAKDIEPAAVAKPDQADLDRSQIIGNRELPKVLYIVPWQDPSGIPKIELDPNFTEHEVFRHLYPPAYKRELQYYDMLKASEAKQ